MGHCLQGGSSETAELSAENWRIEEEGAIAGDGHEEWAG